jgi:ankyrin repeat protein
MTTSQLPARPDLGQLKKQAKDLLASAKDKTPAALARFRALPAFTAKTDAELATLRFALHDAQSVIAREHGFASWNALAERVEEMTLKFEEIVAQFSRGSVQQQIGRAERLLAMRPDLTALDFHAALVFGDVAAVTKRLAADPALATRKGGPLGWEPILYVAHSQWAAKNSEGLVEIALLLLERGASPNTSYAWHGDANAQLPVLWAAACHSHHYALAKVLLEAGAKPDDGESVYHAAEHGDIAMLDLLAAHGAQADGGKGAEPWTNTPLYFILGHYAGLAHDAKVRAGVAWLLAHGANPNHICYPQKSGETPLHLAARHWDGPTIELLLQHGAEVHARRADGRNALTLALLNGRLSAAEALGKAGAVNELTPPEQFIAACMRGDRAEAMRLRDPQAVATHAQLFLEAGTDVLETMLAVGFDVATKGGMGETALHWSCFTGNLSKARLLIAHGAPLDLRDNMYKSPPLGWCDYASVNQRVPGADFAGVARALLEAGATPPTAEEMEHWGSDEIIGVINDFLRERKA